MNYYGQHFTWMDCEMLAIARIRPDLLAEEATLCRTRWFDYRLLHPVKCTYLYAARYQEAVQLLYTRTKDHRTVDRIRAFTPDDVFQSNELVGFWRARQELDRLGVRYEFALRFAMNRFNDRGWRFFPRPNQMLGEEMLLDLRDAWAHECKIRIQTAEDDFYRARNWKGHPDQKDYQLFLARTIRQRPHQHLALGTLLKTDEILPEFAQQVFGESTLKRARVIAASLG